MKEDVEPSAERHEGSPGEPLLRDGRLVASVWAGPTDHRGFPSTVHLTDIMSSLRGSQEEGAHQGIKDSLLLEFRPGVAALEPLAALPNEGLGLLKSQS